MENELVQSGSVVLGLIAVVSLVIRELFSFLKSRNYASGGGEHDAAILRELKTMNTNHLHSLEDAIKTGNERLVDTIHSDNTKMIEILGRIEGGLRK